MTAGACGPLSFGYVDPEWREDFDIVVAELEEATGRRWVVVEEGTGLCSLVADAGLIAARAQEEGKPVGGYVQGFRVVMMPHGDARKRVGALTQVIVAHELGHLLGLDHASSGLMVPSLTSECLGRAGACLAEALGKTP